MSYMKNFTSDELAEIINRVEEHIREYIESKISKKLINSLDILIDVELDETLEVNVEIELDAGPLSEKYQSLIEESVDLAHKILEKELRG